MAAALERLRKRGPAPVQAGDDGPSGNGRRVRLRAAEPTLTGLPTELHEVIAARMGPSDRARLVGSHPDLRDSLRAFSTSDRTLRQGRRVNTLAGLLAMLQDAQSLQERPDLLARPLAALARRVETIPPSHRQSAFAHILATIAQAPDRHRDPLGVALEALADCIVRLPEAARQQAFTQVRQQAEQLDSGLPPSVARRLRVQIATLPAEAQWQAFSDLLQACGSLAPGHRAEMLKELASEIEGLPQAARLPATQAVLAAAEALVPQQCWPVLERLNRQVQLLPEAVQPTVWGAMVRWVLAVPPGRSAELPVGWRVEMLEFVGRRLATLPPDEQQAGYLRALLSVRLLPQPQRRDPLEALARAIPDLPKAARPPAWQAAAHEVEQWRPEHQARGLAVLSGRVGELPLDTRAAAFNRVLQAHRMLPTEHITSSVMFDLADGCRALPRAQWPQAMDRVLEESARLPIERQGEVPLAFGRMLIEAGPAAVDPIDLEPPGSPWPDVRALCFDKALRAAQHPLMAVVLRQLRAKSDRQLQLRPEDAAFLNAARTRIDQIIGA